MFQARSTLRRPRSPRRAATRVASPRAVRAARAAASLAASLVASRAASRASLEGSLGASRVGSREGNPRARAASAEGRMAATSMQIMDIARAEKHVQGCSGMLQQLPLC